MTELMDDLTISSEKEVFSLVETRWKGLLKLRDLIGDKKLQLKNYGGYEIFRKDESSIFHACAEKMVAFNDQLKSITGVQNIFSVSDKKIRTFQFDGINHMIFNKAEGQLNTGEMMKSLIQLAQQYDVQLFYGVNVHAVEESSGGTKIITEQGWEIDSKKTLIATNGFAKKLIPRLNLTPARNQVLITKPIENLPFKGTFHYDRGYYYFRNIEEGENSNRSRILLGGGRNLFPKQEETSEFGTTENIQTALLKILRNVILPKKIVEVDYWWSGILGVNQEKRPIIEMVSPNVGVAVRLGGMGVAIGTHIGEKSAEMLLKS